MTARGLQFTLILLLMSVSQASLASSSWFQRLVTLRFADEVQVVAKSGQADLSQVDPGQLVNLRGEALFFPGVYLPLRYLGADELEDLKRRYRPIQLPLNTRVVARSHEQSLPSTGTFLLRLHDMQKGDWGLRVPRMYHAGALFALTEKQEYKIFQVGSLERDPTDYQTFDRNAVTHQILKVDQDLVLYAYVRAPIVQGSASPNWSTMFLSDFRKLGSIVSLQSFCAKLIVGAFLVIFVFYFLIFLFRREDRSSLYLSVYALLAFGMGCIYERDWIMSPVDLIRGFTALNLGSICVLQLYLLNKLAFLMASEWQRRLNGFVLSLFVSSFISLYWNLSAITSTLFVLSFLSSNILILATVYLGLKHKINGIFYFLTGAAFCAIFQFPVMEMTILNLNEESAYYVLLSELSIAISLALVNAKDFAVLYHKSLAQSRELAQQNRKIQEINERLKEQEQARTLFFQNTSHELRTPLNGIIGFLNLAVEGQYGTLPQMATRQIKKALRLSDSLKTQVNLILDLAKFKRGELQVEYTRFSLLELKTSLDNLAEGLQLKAEDVSFVSSIDAKEIDWVHDRNHVFTIASNLLGNAFKFKDPARANHVELFIRADKQGLRIRVRDSGIGIEAEFREKIFEEFTQIEGGARRSYEGSGLGLAMVKSLVHLHRGRIDLSSQRGQGSIFEVWLPSLALSEQEALLLKPFDLTQESKRHEQDDHADVISLTAYSKSLGVQGQGNSVFVIDDNPHNCELIRDILASEGYRIEMATRGKEALEEMKHAPPHLVLLDLMMPEMSGEDVLLAMKANPQLRPIPVILITARASEEDKIHGLSLGADDYLAKPILAIELRLRVRNVLERVRLQALASAGSSRTHSGLAQDDNQLPVCDLHGALHQLHRLGAALERQGAWAHEDREVLLAIQTEAEKVASLAASLSENMQHPSAS